MTLEDLDQRLSRVEMLLTLMAKQTNALSAELLEQPRVALGVRDELYALRRRISKVSGDIAEDATTSGRWPLED